MSVDLENMTLDQMLDLEGQYSVNLGRSVATTDGLARFARELRAGKAEKRVAAAKKKAPAHFKKKSGS